MINQERLVEKLRDGYSITVTDTSKQKERQNMECFPLINILKAINEIEKEQL